MEESGYKGKGPDPMDELPDTEAAKRFKELAKETEYTYEEFMCAWNWFLVGWVNAWSLAEVWAEKEKLVLRRKGSW